MIRITRVEDEYGEWQTVEHIRENEVDSLLAKLEEGVDMDMVEKTEINGRQTIYKVTLGIEEETYLVDDDALDIKEEEMKALDEEFEKKVRAIVLKVIDEISTECA